jgi:hypothetical protein
MFCYYIKVKLLKGRSIIKATVPELLRAVFPPVLKGSQKKPQCKLNY